MTASETSVGRPPVSVIILTYNESQNIAECLRTLGWADEIIVVDSYSTDDTVARATAARSDVRVLRNRFEDFGQQRNWSIDHSIPRNEWILFVDADERFND